MGDTPKKRYTLVLPPDGVRLPKKTLLPAVCHSDGDTLVMCLVDLSNPSRPKVLNSMLMSDAVAWLISALEPAEAGKVH